MLKLVLLPGMDGTGDLFSAFVAAIRVPTQVVRYPVDQPLGYPALVDRVVAELPQDEPYVLLGESFSGPIALAIAALKPPLLRGVVLCCSFASNPRPSLAPLARLVPCLPGKPPPWTMMPLLAGRFATPELRESLARAVAQVSPAVLRHRLAAVARVNAMPDLPSIEVPLLYLQATQDRLVPASAARTVLQHVAGSRLVTIDAPHLLLQVRPGEAAGAIQDFIGSIDRAMT